MGIKDSTRAHWEKFWQRREQIEEVYSTADRISANLSQVTEFAGQKILEVGAGSGRDSFRLADQEAIVYVLDYASQSLRIIGNLNAQNPSQVHLMQADALQIPIPDNSMDIVFHQGLLEHFKDPLPLLQEHFRILKPGGFLLVDVPQRYHYYTIVKHILIFLNKWFAGWETEFSIQQLKRLLAQAGFRIQHQYGNWMRPSFVYRIIRELLKKAKLKMPLYPSGFQYSRKLRDRLRERLANQRWAFYTFLDIGVIGQKQHTVSDRS